MRIEPLNLLYGKVLTVIAKVGSELIDLAQCGRIDTHAICHNSYRLPAR